MNFKIYNDPQAVAVAAADYLYQQITSCVAKKGQCHVVLPGGSTPANCLELLAQKPLPWKNIHWYPGDERCLPVGHADRNDTMMKKKLFSQQPQTVNRANKNFHPIPTELGALQGAELYARLMAAIPELDIVVLGMGEDGHTASLFPDNVALNDPRSVVPVFDAPKPPAERISIGLQRLKSAAECIVITTGKSKYAALTRVQQGEPLPVSMVEPDVCFVDQAAITGDK
jgi:6-phosphogluconolactonase